MAQACLCNGDGAACFDAARIRDALRAGDLDAALDAGLLAWNGCIACARRAGLAADDVAALVQARDARVAALAARERFRARALRLADRQAERARLRDAAPANASTGLPPAAAAALARAKAKAAAKPA